MGRRLRHVFAAAIASLFVTSMAFTALFATTYLASYRVAEILERLHVLPPDWQEEHPQSLTITCLIATLPPNVVFARWFYLGALKAEEDIERGEL